MTLFIYLVIGRRERHIQTQPLNPGTFSVESLRGASSHEQKSFVALHAAGQAVCSWRYLWGELIYSATFPDSTEVNEWDQTRLLTGHSSPFIGLSKPFYPPKPCLVIALVVFPALLSEAAHQKRALVTGTPDSSLFFFLDLGVYGFLFPTRSFPFQGFSPLHPDKLQTLQSR